MTPLLPPTLRWSQISSFAYDPRQWFSSYVLGITQSENPAMRFGKDIHARIQSDPSFLPTVPRGTINEHRMSAVLHAGDHDGADLPLTGSADAWTPAPHFILDEYKTSVSAKRWTQKTAQEHGQLKFYALMLMLTEKVRPEDMTVRLTWIPARADGMFGERLSLDPNRSPRTFFVRLTTRDILLFAREIKNVRKEMYEYAQARASSVPPDLSTLFPRSSMLS